ncbi:MAG TPA: hypothetical protein VFR90_10785 [Methylibium sp.]|uniref:hypothetical protein n=1 Tax=Methylibium sp. TaxID=2067992 RepID=UPI002DB581A1|nr:hypothetical protein [Methylibium sp.]HEU4459599.1 hypothetical protein [Methylibium sp.]
MPPPVQSGPSPDRRLTRFSDESRQHRAWHDDAAPPGENPDPMQMLGLLTLIHGAMQPLMRMLATQAGDGHVSPPPGALADPFAGPDSDWAGGDEPSDSVAQMLLLLLMESFVDSLGDPFAGEAPQAPEPGAGTDAD